LAFRQRGRKVPRLTFIHANGERESHRVAAGSTVMDCAFDHRVRGLIGQCGGACRCLTCHCYVETPWRRRLPAPEEDEREMLEYALERRKSSRLACQIVVSEALDGLVVRIPKRHP